MIAIDQYDRGPGILDPPLTLGQRLDAMGRKIADRQRPVYAWAPTLVPLLRRADQLAFPQAQRFQRVEVTPRAPGEPGVRGTRASARSALAARDGWPSAEPTPAGSTPPADVRARLRDDVGPAADALRVHHDAAADAAARRQDADAVTVGRDVFVRSGRYLPDTADGLALLAHEAAHVARPDPPPTTDGSVASVGPSEVYATAVERSVRGDLSAAGRPSGTGPTGPTPPPDGSWPVSPRPDLTPTGPFPTASPVGRGRPANAGSEVVPAPSVPSDGLAATVGVHRAAVDRDQSSLAAIDLGALRHQLRSDLMADLMRQLRVDFERGG